MGSGSSKKEQDKRNVKTKLAAAIIISTPHKETEAKKPSESNPRRKDLLEFVESRKHDTQDAVEALKAESHTKTDNKESEQTDGEDDTYQWPETDESHNICPVCHQATLYLMDGFPCRVCARVFHTSCLKESGHYTEEELKYIERAKTNIGWSCEECDNITSLLTPEEMADVNKEFDSVDINQDDDISWTEYLDFQKRQHKLLFSQPMSPSEEDIEKHQFKILDVDGNGSISYIEFLKHRATLKLAARSKHELVKYLRPHEKFKAKHMFDIFDENKDGSISMAEARMAYRSWYTHLENLKKSQRKKSTILNKAQLDSSELSHHVTQNAAMIMQCDEDQNYEVDWREFLRGQSLYIISSRPNKANVM